MLQNYVMAAYLWVAAFWKAIRAGVARFADDVREGYLRGRAGGLEEYKRVALSPDRAQMSGGNLIGLIIGVTVAVIVTVGVAIPITNQVIAESNITGITALIVGFIPVMLGLMVFVATAAPIMART